MSILGALGVLFILDKIFGGGPTRPETKEEYRKRYNRMQAPDRISNCPGMPGYILSVGEEYIHPDEYNPPETKTAIGTIIENDIQPQ